MPKSRDGFLTRAARSKIALLPTTSLSFPASGRRVYSRRHAGSLGHPYLISILSSLILSPNGGLRMGISIQVPFVSVDL